MIRCCSVEGTTIFAVSCCIDFDVLVGLSHKYTTLLDVASLLCRDKNQSNKFALSFAWISFP